MMVLKQFVDALEADPYVAFKFTKELKAVKLELAKTPSPAVPIDAVLNHLQAATDLLRAGSQTSTKSTAKPTKKKAQTDGAPDT